MVDHLRTSDTAADVVPLYSAFCILVSYCFIADMTSPGQVEIKQC